MMYHIYNSKTKPGKHREISTGTAPEEDGEDGGGGRGGGVGDGVGLGGGGGGIPAPPRKMPERTALAPATRSMVIVTEPPPGTLIGKCIQAPALKEVVMLTVLVVVPSATVTFWRRVELSQSSA